MGHNTCKQPRNKYDSGTTVLMDSCRNVLVEIRLTLRRLVGIFRAGKPGRKKHRSKKKKKIIMHRCISGIGFYEKL